MKRIDLSGEKYGRLTVIEYSHTNKGIAFWKCRCDCGNTASVAGGKLKTGKTKSCGCLKLENVRRQRKKNEYEIFGEYARVRVSDTEYMPCDTEDWEKTEKSLLEHMPDWICGIWDKQKRKDIFS